MAFLSRSVCLLAAIMPNTIHKTYSVVTFAYNAMHCKWVAASLFVMLWSGILIRRNTSKLGKSSNEYLCMFYLLVRVMMVCSKARMSSRTFRFLTIFWNSNGSFPSQSGVSTQEIAALWTSYTQRSWWEVYWFHSVRPSVCPSVPHPVSAL